MPRVLLLLLALCAADMADPPEARAQVRRCVMPDGQTVYTDRRCEAMGAVERRPDAVQPRIRTYRPGCARSVRDLYFELGAAIEAQDVNRLAGLYHWPGMSTAEADRVMRRLQAIVDRPLVDLQPIYPGVEGNYAPGRRPWGFRIEQVSAGGSTPVRAVLGLRQHLACWWITLGGPPRAAAPRAAREAPVADGSAPATTPGLPEDAPR